MTESSPWSPDHAAAYEELGAVSWLLAEVVAVLDWEICTLGDPLADVGYMMMHWVQCGRSIMCGWFFSLLVSFQGFRARSQHLLPCFSFHCHSLC